VASRFLPENRDVNDPRNFRQQLFPQETCFAISPIIDIVLPLNVKWHPARQNDEKGND
jgi:hypothetical protein